MYYIVLHCTSLLRTCLFLRLCPTKSCSTGSCDLQGSSRHLQQCHKMWSRGVIVRLVGSLAVTVAQCKVESSIVVVDMSVIVELMIGIAGDDYRKTL